MVEGEQFNLERPDIFDSLDDFFYITGNKNNPIKVQSSELSEPISQGKHIKLEHVIVTGDLVFDGYFPGEITLKSASIRGALGFRGEFDGRILLAGVEVQNFFSIDSAKINKGVRIERLSLAEEMHFYESYFSEILIGWSDFQKSILLNDISVKNDFAFFQNSTEVEGSVNLIDVEFGGNVRFEDNRIGEDLELFDSQIHGDAKFEDIATQELILSGIDFDQGVEISSIKSDRLSFHPKTTGYHSILSDLDIDGLISISTRRPSDERVAVLDSFATEGIFFSKTNFRDIEIKQVEAGGRTEFNYLETDGRLDITGSKFTDLYFTSVKIGNQVRLSDVYVGGVTRIWKSSFGAGPFVDRSIFNSRVIFDKVSFEGYVRFRNVDFNGKLFAPWFSAETLPGLRDVVRFDKQFFSFLIQNFESLGLYQEADDVFYRSKVAESNNKSYFFKYIDVFFLDFTFGYGVKPLNLFLSFIVVLVFYMGLYFVMLSMKGRAQVDRSGFDEKIFIYVFRNIRLNLLAWSLHHSFDQMTPGIDLRSKSPSIIKALNNIPAINGKAMIYIENSQRIIGWFLLLLLVVMFGKLGVR